MRQLYVTSNDTVPKLIGILTEITPGSNNPYGSRGDYRFEYKLNPNTSKTIMEIEYFPNRTKTYNGADVLEWLTCYLPSTNGKRFFTEALKSVDLTKYNEWEWLKAFGKINVNANILLFEQMPKGTIRYDK